MKRKIKRTLLALGAAQLALFALMLVRALTMRSMQITAPPADDLAVDQAAAAERLAQAIRFPTVSHQDPAHFEEKPFVELQAYLEKTFPRVHERLEHEIVARHSLLYTWKGKDPSQKPMVLMGHMDVVPAPPDTMSKWSEPPFSGNIKDGFIWGRGSLDDKISVLGILEAIELLLSRGHEPKRTIHLAFGHDEEVNGTGAKAIAELLKSRGIKPELVLDEGLMITQGLAPGVSAPVALIGVAQKGYVSLELTVVAEGGHSSIPPEHTAVGILSAAIAKLEEHPMPASLTGPPRQMLEYLAPEASFPLRLVFSNLWITSPLVERIFLGSPNTAALVRTTTAPTILDAGVKENVLPTKARAVVNFRIRPSDSIAAVEERVAQTIGDPRVTIEMLSGGHEPSGVASVESPTFAMLQRSLRRVAPEVVVAPGLMVGTTDARHYAGMSENIYMFLPVLVRREDLARYHGINERVSIADYVRCVRFYAELIRESE